MRADLDYLPAAKWRELERVVPFVFEKIGDVNALAQGKRKAGP